MDELLLLLLKHGAHQKAVKLTTAQLGTEAGMSQQNASHRLMVLEKRGYVERKNGTRLTRKACDELAKAYAVMKKAFDAKPLEISGVVTSGFQEGRYYLSMPGYRNQIKEKLGFAPFPGTLNIRLDEADRWKRQHLQQLDPVVISGFSDGRRTYGNLLAYKCSIGRHECALVVPLRTHHGQGILEIISPVGIKKKFGMKDGDRIKITV